MKESLKSLAALALQAGKAMGRIPGIVARPSWFRLDRRVSSLIIPKFDEHAFPSADILIATAWNTAMPAWHAPNRCGRKVYYVHEHEGNRAPMKRVDPTYDLPMAYIARNENVAAMLRNRNKRILTKIPSGIDPQCHRLLTPPQARDSLCIGMMYSRSEIKAPGDGFRAIRLLQADLPGLKPIVFGAFPPPPELPPGCEYLYRPTDEEVGNLYNRMAIFFSSSWIEGWCVPIHEAMASGCAVVATNTWGIHEYARHEENALIVPPKQPDLLAAAVKRLMQNHALRLRLARSGYETAKRITWEHATILLEKALEHLLREKP